jgi:leucyl-tRNA synthetase
MVLAPEHRLVDELTVDAYREVVQAYQHQAARQSEIERTATDKEKTGVFIGAYAINPVNNMRIPIWIADYVMMTYGTGAIMAVPSHDERDFAFALKFGLSILPVIDRPDGVAKSLAKQGAMKEGFAEALAKAGIPFDEKDGSLCVTMNRDQVDRYISLARAYLESGSWTEVVGARWAFVFDDGVQGFDSVEAGRQIVARCRALEPAVGDKRTVMGRVCGQRAASRLAHQPPAVLGGADSHDPLPDVRHRAGALRGSAGAAAGGCRVSSHRRKPAQFS